MINVDTRILGKLDENEYWLLTHLIKFLGKKESVWPSNKTLCRDTGWHIDKLQRIKKSLIEKKLISVEVKFNTSNIYRFHTKLLKIYIELDGQELHEHSTVKNSIQFDAKSNKLSTVKHSNEVLVNEVLVNEASESKDSDSQKPLTSDTMDLSIEPEKKTTIAEIKKSCYLEFVRIWCESYPELGFNDVSGAKIKSMVNHSIEIVKLNSGELTHQKITGVFEYILAYAKRTSHWAHGKSITSFDGKYREIYNEIKHGKSGQKNQVPSSHVFGKYSNLR